MNNDALLVSSYGRLPRPGVIGALKTSLPMLGLGLLVGFVAVADPHLAVVLALGGVIVTSLSASPTRTERVAVMILLAGAIVLNYGFANIGVAEPIPLPLTEILLIPLAIVALSDRRYRLSTKLLLPLTLFLGIVAARLIVDYPTYKSLALRDATIAIEAFALVIGYRSLEREGLSTWIIRLRILSLLTLAYASLYPWRDILRHWSPTVGLQRGVPLLGSFEGIQPAVLAATLFFATYSRGMRRVMFVTWGVALIGIYQARALYLVLPLAVAALGWGMRRPVKTILVWGLSLLTGAVILSSLAGVGIQGRVGPLTSNFYAAHFDTLLGGGGPEAGSLDARVNWTWETIAYVRSSPTYIAFGVGLGPDLAFGFLENGERLVRKPHDDYLEIFARTGVLGFSVFIWLLVSALRPIARAARAKRDEMGRLCTWILASSLVYLAVAATQPLLSFPYGTVPLFFLLGVGVAAARSQDRQRV